MWIDINKGYISESTIEYIELVVDGNVTSIRMHLISGRTIDITGELARRILEYASRNKVEFLDRLYNPINLDGLTL
jgi:predicted translin family RNA/ssDNA-binding protein